MRAAFAERLPSEAEGALVLNCASGTTSTVNDLTSRLETALGRSVATVHEPPRTGDIRHSSAAIDRIQDALGFAPTVPLAEGLRRTAASYPSTVAPEGG